MQFILVTENSSYTSQITLQLHKLQLQLRVTGIKDNYNYLD